MISLLLNVNLYNPAFMGLKDVLVSGGKIAKVFDVTDTRHREIPAQWDAEVIDFDGAILTPGFIDCHTHVTGGGGEAGFSTQVPPVPLSKFTGVGVTTVIGLLGTDDTTRTTGGLLSRVYALREEGMSAYCWTGGYHYPLTTLTGNAKSDIVFIEPIIGIGELAISDHRSSQPTFEEIIKLASEAHVAGLMTGKAGVLHLHLGDGERRLELVERAITETEIPARVFHPTHVNRNRPLFEDSCKLLERGCYIDITAFPEGPPDDPAMQASEAIALAVERNLPLDKITISSDGGGCLPLFNCQGELEHMDLGESSTLVETIQATHATGIPLETVLPMFTSNVAKLLRLNSKGQIMPGRDADLLVFNKNLELTDVMANGRWHKRNNEQKIIGTFE